MKITKEWLVEHGACDEGKDWFLAVFVAEQAILCFEDKNPSDQGPRLAINAAKRVLRRNTKKTREMAYNAAASAYWRATAATCVSACAVSMAAYAAAYAASTAADNMAASAVARAAEYPVYAAWMVQTNKAAALRMSILTYGLSLLKK